jgi:glycosyltransferase involved in cell wall biosynthesis
VGRLVKLKRPLVAIEAFGRIASEIPGARLTIVGEGPLGGAVRGAAERTEGRVEAVGRVEGGRLRSLYEGHDALLVTSVREVWGLVVNEALQHGLFVVSCDRVGSARCLVEKQTGELVPPDDVDGFVAALRRAFAATRDPGSRSIRREGRIRLCTHQAFADRYVEAIELAVARRA